MKPDEGITLNIRHDATQSIFRAFAIGDSLLGPPLYHLRSATTDIVSYQPASVPAALRRILPGLMLDDGDIIGRDGVNTTGLAGEIDAIVAARAGYDLALVSVGLCDCEQTTRGVAPEPAATVAALERIVGSLLRASIRPVLLLPPPHELFANGLFADRFICVSATLRRLARQFPELILVDPTDRLKRPGSFGIEPRADLAETGGKLTIAGAFGLAELIVDALLAACPSGLLDRPHEPGSIILLPSPPEAAADDTSTKFVLDGVAAGGMAADATITSTGPARIRARGNYSSQWPFLKLQRAVQASCLENLVPGDSIAATAEIRIGERSQGLASVSLQITPVWETGYAGVSSCEFHGQMQIGDGRMRLLQTPRFALPAPLKALNIALMMHFQPATDGTAEATVDVMSIELAHRAASRP